MNKIHRDSCYMQLRKLCVYELVWSLNIMLTLLYDYNPVLWLSLVKDFNT